MLDQYILPDNQLLKISFQAFQVMKAFIQYESESNEAGGILVGRVVENFHFIIDDVSTPMPSDQRQRNHFFRYPQGHQEFFNTRWEDTKERCYYLGEWHTHPEPYPEPSNIDLTTWRRLLRNPTQDIKALFFIILGTSHMRIWKGTNTRGMIRIEVVADTTIEM
jgi:integrative and conjugative element protein (TIGR02256 family)